MFQSGSLESSHYWQIEVCGMQQLVSVQHREEVNRSEAGFLPAGHRLKFQQKCCSALCWAAEPMGICVTDHF